MFLKDRRDSSRSEQLAIEVEKVLTEMKAAENMLNYSDEPELVESAILEMESARKRYNYLLRQLKTESLKGEGIQS